MVTIPKRTDAPERRPGRLRIPGAENVQAVGRRERGGAPNVPAPITADIGADIFNLGVELAEKDRKQQKLDEAIFLEETEAAHRQEFAREIIELEKTVEPSDSSYPDRVDEISAKLQEKYSKLQSPHGLEETQKRLASTLRVSRINTVTAALKANNAATETKALDLLQEGVNDLNKRAFDAPDSYGALRVELEEKMKRFAGDLGEDAERDELVRHETSLLQSAINGLNDRGRFDEARALLKDDELTEFLTGEKREAFLSDVDASERAAEIDAAKARKEAENALKSARIQTQNEFIERLQPGHPNPLTAKDILQSNLLPIGESGSKEHYLKLLQSGPTTTDPAIFNDLFSRIHLPDGDPNKIVDEDELNPFVVAGKLSFEDLGKLRGEMQGRRTQAGDVEGTLKKGLFAIAKSELTGTSQLSGLRDPRGDTQLQKFTSFFLTEYTKQREAGKSALQLLSPDSPDYIGKAINQFKRTPQEFMRDLMESNPTMGFENLSPEPPLR